MFVVDDEQEKQPILKADIRIIGIGGGGNNSIETMIRNKVKNVKFIAVNTDAQALAHCSCETKIQLGEKLTKGLGAGANPHIGHRAALESYDEIVRQIQGADMLFITAGMGGGTGTGGAPVIAEAAKELGILTVGFVTRPFLCEGSKRRRQADMGIEKLKKHVDTLITLPNERLLDISENSDSLIETFKKTDEILLQAVKGIADLVNVQGLINLDFADVKTVMSNKGMALMSIGTAQGPQRAVEAVARALDSPLLSDVSIKGATGMIVNITSDSRLSLKEVNKAISCLTKEIDPDADIIVGTVIDETMEDRLSITLVATGFLDNTQTQDSIAKLSQTLKGKTILNQIESQVQAQPEPAPGEDEQAVDQDFLSYKGKEATSQAVSEEEFTDLEKTTEINPEEFTESTEQISDNKEEIPVSSHNVTLRDKLLLKAQEYAKEQPEIEEKPDPSVLEQKQMSIDWDDTNQEDSSFENISSSPFESGIDFSEDDMI